MSDEIHEECGIIAVAGHPRASELCYYGLHALQHRGQESAGIAVLGNDGISTKKGMGLVSEVFDLASLRDLVGSYAIGHVRYSTTGASRIENAQPFTFKMWRGQISLAHNGNIVNAGEIRKSLELRGSIFETTSDSEVVPHLLARCAEPDLVNALKDVLSRLQGAFSFVMMDRHGIYATRDPYGFRPLCMGKLDNAFVIASETCALDAIGAEFLREVSPGEIIQVIPGDDGDLKVRSVVAFPGYPSRLCVFEFIYFARPDSEINGLNVHAVRKALGRRLAKKAPVVADLVTGVPDSSLSAASGYAEEAGLPYEMGLVKNRYVGRTFISPGQSLREFAVKLKLNPLKSLISGKRVVLVDDSIVRGTTSKYIVSLLRDAGAREVHLRISSPPYRFPCYYGIDTSSSGELIASSMDVCGMQKELGADSLAFLDLTDLYEVLGSANYCVSCFTGEYPVGVCRVPGKGGASNAS